MTCVFTASVGVKVSGPLWQRTIELWQWKDDCISTGAKAKAHVLIHIEEPSWRKILAPWRECGGFDLHRFILWPSRLEENSDYKTVAKCPTKASNNSVLIIVLITVGTEGGQSRWCPHAYCHHFRWGSFEWLRSDHLGNYCFSPFFLQIMCMIMLWKFYIISCTRGERRKERGTKESISYWLDFWRVPWDQRSFWWGPQEARESKGLLRLSWSWEARERFMKSKLHVWAMFTLGLAPSQTPWLRIPTPHPQIQTVIIVLGYPSELDGKILLLKTPYTLVTGHGEIKLVLISFGWPAL